MIRIRDEQHWSYFRELRTIFVGLKYLNSLMRIEIRDGKILIRDKHPGTGTLDISLTTNLSVLDSYPRPQQVLPVHFIHGIIRIPA